MSDSVNDIKMLDAPVAPHAGLAKAWACLELAKPRIALLVLVATGAGFFMGLPASANWSALPLLMDVLWGTALVAAGANAINQWMEAEHDARMPRTAGRPLPTGRLSAAEVFTFGMASAGGGVIWLTLWAGTAAALVAAVTFLLYVLVYTPLKRVTPLCVFVGAVPGALPPVIGWAAASGELTAAAFPLFAIVFLWQLPHFAAIAWLYRDDYAAAGYPMLAVVDHDGHRTNLHMITHSVGLLAVSLLPVINGQAGVIYAAGAMVLGLAFLGFGISFVLRKSIAAARQHLLASITYLPALCAFLLADRLIRLLQV